jgi:hypothetical protein
MFCISPAVSPKRWLAPCGSAFEAEDALEVVIKEILFWSIVLLIL